MSSVNILEFLTYVIVSAVVMFLLFYRDPYLCLYFFIIWLPLQNFILAKLAILDIFSDSLIIFLSSLKELALIILLLSLFLKKQLFRGKYSVVDYLLIANILFLSVYFFLPNSFFGYPGNFADRIFGLRFSLISLLIFIAGRSVTFSFLKIKKALKLLIVITLVIVIFGFIEVLFIPRYSLIDGLIAISKLKGGENNLYLRENMLAYIMDYGKIEIKRMMSFFLSPLGFAYFLILPFCFMLVYPTDLSKRKINLFRHAVFILILISCSVIFSNTRAVILALIFVAIIYSLRKSFKSLILVLSFLIIIFMLTPLKTVFIETQNLSDSSSAAHAFAYVIGLEKVMNHPLGIGLGQAGPIAAQMGGEGIYGGDEASVGESLYLTVAVERGLPGLLLFMMFIISIGLAGREVGENKEVGENEDCFIRIVLGKSIVLATIAYIIASIPTEVWLGFQSSAIYWWFAGLVVQLKLKA